MEAMSSQGSVTRLIQDLGSTDPAVYEKAARLIWDRYFRGLLQLAQAHLSPRVRRREDEEDILQSMYASFCRRQRRGDFDLVSRDELWGLLVTITLRKARNVAKRQHRLARDVGRELEGPITGDGAGPSRWALEQMEAMGPTPAEAAVMNEALEGRLGALADPILRRVALLKLEGYTNQEIAAELAITERTVERKLERIRARWATCEDGPARE
jgi:DNA-directed RNA polymerase specialized sigma24 family protein